MGSLGQGNNSGVLSLKMWIWEKLGMDIYSIGRHLFLIVLFLWENESSKLKFPFIYIFVLSFQQSTAIHAVLCGLILLHSSLCLKP